MKVDQVLNLLSDGRFHSGTSIAEVLGVSRTSVWKHIQEIQSLGAEVYSVKGKGYRIPGGLDLLSKDKIVKRVQPKLEIPLTLEIVTRVASTNQYLMSKPVENGIHVCTAEYQSAGRGRLGRIWHSPLARNMYISLRLTLPVTLNQLTGLSLAVGCGVAKAIEAFGASEIKLKWPNDLRIGGKKVGGILIEIPEHNETSTDIVIGIGINWDMPETDEIDQSWHNLKPFCDTKVARNQVLSELIIAIYRVTERFTQRGFEAFYADWNKFDEFIGQKVVLQSSKRAVYGISKGVNEAGALKLETSNGLESFVGGELSLRPA